MTEPAHIFRVTMHCQDGTTFQAQLPHDMIGPWIVSMVHAGWFAVAPMYGGPRPYVEVGI